MVKKTILIIDAIINLILGIILLMFNPYVYSLFGIPGSDINFYPNILGGIFIGITIALVIEAFKRKESQYVGLGLTGAVCINICGGLVLTLWLIFGKLELPLKGEIILWILVIVLLVISSIELVFNVKSNLYSR